MAAALLAVQAGSGVRAQTASLPASWTGPWEYSTPPAGWVFSGLGVDYNPDYDGNNDGAAKLDDTGDYISIAFDGPAASVSYWIRGLTILSGAVFRVEQSTDGAVWTALHTYTNPPSAAAFERRFPALDARRLRFVYTEKITGNVGLDGIVIDSYVQPSISAWSQSGEVVRVTVPTGSVGRSYVLEGADVLIGDPWVEWTQVDAQTGAGGTLDLTDDAVTNAARFYRVRDATP